MGAAALHAVLVQRDPATAARLRPTDPQRVTRALEVLDATGRGLSEWQREPARPVLRKEDTIGLLMSLERDTLYTRADARLDAMIQAGAVAEVERLAARQLSPELPVMRALGVRPLLAAIRREASREQAIAAAQIETRHYIKRQITWQRRNMIAWKAITQQDSDRIVEQGFTLI